jgi:hypothetical protein
VRRTVPPSAEIEEQIDRLLAVGVGENPRESLSELAKLGARLIIQRAVEDEFDAWLGRARYERRPAHQRGLRNYDSGRRNGFRPRKVQTLEGALQVEIPPFSGDGTGRFPGHARPDTASAYEDVAARCKSPAASSRPTAASNWPAAILDPPLRDRRLPAESA